MKVPKLTVCRELGESSCECVVWPRWYAEATGRTAHLADCYVTRAMGRAKAAGVAHDPWRCVSTWVSVRTDGDADGMGHPCFGDDDGPPADQVTSYPVRYVRYTPTGCRELGLEPGAVAFAFIETGTLDEDAALAEALERHRMLTDADAWGDAEASARYLGGEPYDNGPHREAGVRLMVGT